MRRCSPSSPPPGAWPAALRAAGPLVRRVPAGGGRRVRAPRAPGCRGGGRSSPASSPPGDDAAPPRGAESARWLISRSRADQAQEIVDSRRATASSTGRTSGPRARRSGGLPRPVPGGQPSAGWCSSASSGRCHVAPIFAIFTFAPTVFEYPPAGGPRPPGTLAAQRGRRRGRAGRQAHGRPGRTAGAADPAVLGDGRGARRRRARGARPGADRRRCFAVFSSDALPGDLAAVSPIEMLPTEVRSAGVGTGAAFGRVGGGDGAFLLPVEDSRGPAARARAG